VTLVHHNRGMRRTVVALWVVAALSVGLLVAGCGSSKPDYCGDLTNLKGSVQGLGSVNVVQNGVSSLTTAIDKVKSDAQTLASSAKGALAPQVDDLEKSLDALETSLKQLSSSDTRVSALSNLPSQLTALQTSSQSLVTAAQKCD